MKAPEPKRAVEEHIPWSLWRLYDTQLHLFLALIASVMFSNGVFLGMAFDDNSAIMKNPDAHADKTSLGAIFFNDFWGKPLHYFDSNGSYRPITVLTFRLQHWLTGYEHNAAFLHSFNFVIAYLNVCFVFYLTRLYVYVAVPTAARSNASDRAQSLKALLLSPQYALPLMAALLYLVHPVHVDAVTSIVGRAELLYCFFGMIGFFCINRFLNSIDGQTSVVSVTTTAVGDRRGRGLSGREGRTQRIATEHYLVYSICALVLSILCKDSAITFTAVYGLHACVMYASGRCAKGRSLVVIVLAILELSGYLLFRREFIGRVDLRLSPLLHQTEHPQYFVPKGVWHWLSMRWLIQVTNIKLLFFPTSLCNEYSFDCISHVHSWEDPRVPGFAAITVTAVFFVSSLLVGTFVYRSRVALAGLCSFFWFAIPYAPVSHLFIAVGTFIAERCLYVPSVGAVLLITFAVAAPGLRVGTVKPYFYALLLLCLGWGIFSHYRNEDWKSNEHLSLAATRTCPRSGKAHYQLAVSLSGRLHRVSSEAVALARKSIALDPSLKGGYYLMALYELQTNQDVHKSYDYLRKCMDSMFSDSYCQALYEQVRHHLFPNMTEVEGFVDLAELTPRNTHKAVYLFQAADKVAAGNRTSPCLANSLLHESLLKWNSANLYWMPDEVLRGSGDITYCSALYWYLRSSSECERQTMAGITEPAGTSVRGVGEGSWGGLTSTPPMKYVDLTPQEAVSRATTAAKYLRNCETNWRSFLSEPAYNFPTIPYRMNAFVSSGIEAHEYISHLLNYTTAGTPERVAVLLRHVDITVSLLCHLTSLIDDRYVWKKVSRLFGDHLEMIKQKTPMARELLLSRLQRVVGELETSKSLSFNQLKTLKNLAVNSPCSKDLVSLMQEL